MFGNKNKNDLEELQKTKASLESIVEEAAACGGVYEANRMDIANSQRQMVANMNQIASNYLETKQMAEQNSKAQTDLVQTLLDAVSRLKTTESQYGQLQEKIRTQTQHCVELVDQNKHFTSPTKRITESVSGMLAQQRERSRQCVRIGELADQMDEQAMVVSEEIQRTKTSPKSIAAMEQVRYRIADVRSELQQLQQKNEEAEKQITELSEQVRYLVGLLKENNMTMAQLFKENHTTLNSMEKFQISPKSGELSEWREQVVGMHNVEEEILKLQERNRIQLEDVAEEIQVQNRAQKEIKEKLSPVFTQAKEYTGKR